MPNDKLRYAIAFEAARLMYQRVESEYYTAKRKAAKRLCRHNYKPEDLRFWVTYFDGGGFHRWPSWVPPTL